VSNGGLTPDVQPFDFWTEIELPDFGSIEILRFDGLSFPPFAQPNLNVTQIIPEFAPGGTDTHHAYVGNRSRFRIEDLDSFTFEKAGSARVGWFGLSSDWPTIPTEGEGLHELRRRGVNSSFMGMRRASPLFVLSTVINRVEKSTLSHSSFRISPAPSPSQQIRFHQGASTHFP